MRSGNLHEFEQALIDILEEDSSDEKKAEKLLVALESISNINHSLKTEAAKLQRVGVNIGELNLLSVDHSNEKHKTPLSIAAEKGCSLCIQLLISAGAKNKAVLDATPLMYAAANGEAKCVEQIIKITDNLEKMTGSSSPGFPQYYNALKIAAKEGKIDAVKLLLDAKAQINNRDDIWGERGEDRFTPLMVAATFDQPEIVELLCERKANVKATIKYDETALHMALKPDYFTDAASLRSAYILLMHGAQLKMSSAHWLDEPSLLFKLLSKEKNKYPYLSIQCAVYLENFLQSLPSLDEKYILLLTQVKDFIEESRWKLPLIHEKTKEYLYESEPLLKLPRDLTNIIAFYVEDTPGEQIVSKMTDKELREKRNLFFAKASTLKDKKNVDPLENSVKRLRAS